MKICYVNKGIGIHDQKILKYLADTNEVHLISYWKEQLPKIDKLIIHQMPILNPMLAYPIGCLITPILVRKIKPDILIGNYLLTYGFYSALAHHHPLLQMAWGSDVLIAPNKNWLYRFVVKYSLKHADMVAIDCEYGKKAIVNLGFPENKIIVFPIGIDVQNKFNPEINDEDIRINLGWQDKIIITCTRGHDTIYGIEYLLLAIPEIVRNEPDSRFLFIGSGPLTPKFKNIVNDLGIENYVKFIGFIQNDELGKYLSASDVYVSPSLSDGTSVSLLEAMACGLPVVVTDVDAIMEWITDGINGFIVPKRNSSVLTQKIVKLIRDDHLRELFGKENRQIAENRGSWQNTTKAFENVFSTLTNKV